MKNKITFGECLKFMLETLDISYSKLSKGINVDSSLISLWVNHKRIPRYSSSYIDDISKYFSRNILNTFQEKKLCVFFSNYLTEDHSTSDYKENIRKVLLESQIFSIEIRNIKKNQAKIDEDIKTKDKDKQVEYMNSQLEKQPTSSISSVGLSNNDKIIYGNINILNTVTKILKTASTIEAINNETIYLIFNNDYDLLKKNPLLKSLLLSAMDKNWQICFIIRIDLDIEKIKNFMKFITPLIPIGKVIVLYASDYKLFNSNREICLVSRTGLLSAFHSNPSYCTDFALYFQNKTVIETFENYVETLIISNVLKPVIFYSEYNISQILSIAKKGAQFNYNSISNMLLMPQRLYNKLLNIISISKNERSFTLEYYKMQLEKFIANLQYYKYKEIIFAEKIEEMIINKSMEFFSSSGIAKVKLNNSDIKEYINNIIYIIQTYDNYQVAVIYKDTEDMFNNIFNFNIKDRYSVYYTFFTPQHENLKVCLTIQEPTVVKAITEMYNETWESLSPMNRDKDETISWLRNCLDMIQ